MILVTEQDPISSDDECTQARLLLGDKSMIKTTTISTEKFCNKAAHILVVAMVMLWTTLFFGGSPARADDTGDIEARRVAMLQAWLYEDHTRITNEQDRRKYKLPPLGTPEAIWWEIQDGRKASLFSRGPLTIAGEGPNPVIPSPFNYDEAWRRVANE